MVTIGIVVIVFSLAATLLLKASCIYQALG